MFNNLVMELKNMQKFAKIKFKNSKNSQKWENLIIPKSIFVFLN